MFLLGAPLATQTQATPNFASLGLAASVSQQVERRNPHHHPLIKAFWDGVPADRKGTPIQVICRKVGTSTNQVLALLGLGPQACGGFHLKGACRRPNCTFDHSVQQVPDEGARQVSAKLTEGMAALTAPQA